MATGNAHYLLYGYMGSSTVVLRLEMRSFQGDYQVRAALINDSTTWTSTSWFTVRDQRHFIELDWRAATASGANNGGVTLWIDGAQKADINTIDNDTRRVDFVRVGPVSGIDTGTRGAYYSDAFESRASTYIGPEPGAEPIPTPPLPGDVIFSDGFETGGLSAWSANANDGGDLSVSAAAALNGAYGLRAVLDDNNAIHVSDWAPFAEKRYRARFYFDPNSITMTSGDAHYLFYAYQGETTVVARLEFRRYSGNYQIRAALVNDASTWTNTSWQTISDASHYFEIDWRASSGPGANNGGLTLWIDSLQKASLTGVDNDTRVLDFVRLGAVAGIDTGTRGTYYFDAFASTRSSYLGQHYEGITASFVYPRKCVGGER